MQNSKIKSIVKWLMVSASFSLVTNLQAQNQKKEMNTVITMLVTFHVKQEQKETMKTALMEDAEGARKEKGNVTMELYEHRDKPNILYLFERWENQKALDEHFEKTYTKNVLELNKTSLTSPMEILYLNDIVPLPKKELKKPLPTDSSVDLIVVFTVKEGLQERFINQFRKSIQNSRPEHGNIAFHLYRVNDNGTMFVLYERWKDQAALDFHFEQPYTKALFEVFNITLDRPVEENLNYVREIRPLK